MEGVLSRGYHWSTSGDIGQQAGGTHPTGMHSCFNSGSFCRTKEQAFL